MPPITIKAQGTSTIFRQAERAVIFVQISSEGTSQEEVSKDVVSTANDLRAMLKSLAPKTEQGDATPDAAVTHWKNKTLSTSSYERWSRGSKEGDRSLERHYLARTAFEIKVRDFERLGSLVTSLATMPHVAVSNIEWRLTEATTASLGTQSRQDAVRDAVARARDYAAVLGRGTPVAVEVIDDVKGLSNLLPVTVPYAATGGCHHQGQERGDMLDLEPESVQLHSSVTIKFTAD